MDIETRQTKTAYFISGLGADYRVFAQLDLPNVEQIHIEWVPPTVEDTMKSYAQKLLPQIDLAFPITLIGLSFGGMLAVELSKLIPNCQTILISSATTAAAIPKKYKFLGIHKLLDKIPFSVFRRTNALGFYLFGVKSQAHKSLLNNILIDTDEFFFRWAIKAILAWENDKIPSNLTQIHGCKDKVLPLVALDVIKIENGGHLMVLSESVLISSVLRRVINGNKK